MYSHHSQQQGPQSFSDGSRPHHHPNQHQHHTPSELLAQEMGFKFPRPTQLPDELESVLALRGARDMDHRLIDQMSPSNQPQNPRCSISGISQHGTYGSTSHTADNQLGHKQGVDWTSYQPSTKLFASPSPRSGHQSQPHRGPQQQLESSNTGTSIPGWTAIVSESPSPQGSNLQSGGGGDSQCFYTPESAGSILASFGLSNEDLEVLSHYPDDQLTPDTLPFILRDIQINKSGKQKTVSSTSPSLFLRSSINNMPEPSSHSLLLTNSRSPEVPSLLAVTQTAGKVIDYGHASRTKGESTTRETFKREPLSSERTVNLYPPLSSSSSSLSPKADEAERRRVHTENTEPTKNGDRDYRASTDHHKSSRSAGTELDLSKTRNLDRDYRHEGPKPRPSSNSSGSKPRSNGSKKLPTPTMISDFSAVSPKVYPHTCSLCHIQCDQEKDWVEHINTVNHTAACRDLRNKYPDWKPKLPSRSGRYGSRAVWDPKDGSPSHSAARSLSCSPTTRLTRKKQGLDSHPHRPHGKHYSPHNHPRYHHNSAGHRLEHHHSGSHSPSRSHRTSSASREHRSEKRERELGASPGVFSRGALKRPTSDSTQCGTDTTQHASSSKAGHISKHGPSQYNRKNGTKTGAVFQSTKPPPTKKKKKTLTPVSQDLSVVDCLIYLTGIPNDASEQEVTDLVGSFGKINNVILLTCSMEDSERVEGQKASVCMEKAEDAKALANSTSLSIRDQQITALKAKKPGERQSCDVSNSKIASGDEKCAVGESSGREANQKTSDAKGMVLITGLPENNWSESDIIKLIQPFGTPSDIILATQIGKVLVSVPDMDIAEEIVKIHTFSPAKINESDLKIIHVKQHIGFSTPVALYNLLMGSVDPLENPVPVGWSSLLVISNVPNTPSSSSEVQKLVQRFGTVIKTLVLNSMVICEMATAAMALSVYKRFQMFPCIIHNNPLFFSRKPDPKAKAKVNTAYMDSSEHRLNVTTNGNHSQTAAAANKEEMARKEKSECLLEAMEENVAGMDEKMKYTENTFGEEAASKASKEKDKLASAVSSLDVEMSETSAVKAAVATAEENKLPNAPKEGTDKSTADKVAEPSSSDDKTASREMVIPDLPKKVTTALVNDLLVECRTRTSSHPTNIIVSTSGEQEETQSVTEHGEKAVKETKEPTKNFTEEIMKERQDREREVRKEKEERERVRKERDRRPCEREEKLKRDREWDERGKREREDEKREWERRQREGRRGKRSLSEDLAGSRSFSRSEGYKQSSMRDVLTHKSEAKTRVVEEGEEFPFNISDFVTVDEVGDVTDLLCSPLVVPTETTEGGEETPTSVHKDTTEETPMDVATETTATVTPVELNEPDEAEPMTVPTAWSPDSLVILGLSPAEVLTTSPSSNLPASHVDLSLNQKHVVTCQIDAPETEKLISEVEQFTMPAAAAAGNQHESTLVESSSDSPEALPMTAESEEGKKEDSTLSHSQAKEEEVAIVMLDKQEKHKGIGATAAEIVKTESSEKHTHTQEESVKKTVQTKTTPGTDCSLPPFDPNNPIGMELLVPKTGFFCKACNRFFSGTKEMEISHCKTIKHYENLQKYLGTAKVVNNRK